MPSSQNGRNLQRLLRQVGILTVIPLLLVAGPLLGYTLGRFVDAKLESAPWGLIVGILLGFVASVRETASLIRKAQDER